MKKKCTKCKREKLMAEFPNNKFHADGKQSWCKQCYQEKQKVFKEEKKYFTQNVFI